MVMSSKTDEELLAEFEPQIATTVEYERQIWQARFSPCGQFLCAAGYDARIPRWKLAGDEFAALPPLESHHGWVQCLDFAASSKRLLTADSWGKLCCWDYQSETPETVWADEEAHDGWIRGLHCSPDGKLVATGGNDHVLRIWSVDDGEKQIRTSARASDLQHLLPPGRKVADDG
jgi:WD40 repeat protein